MDVETSGNVYGMVQAGGLESVEHGFKTAPTTPSDEVPLAQETKRTVSDGSVFEKPEMIPFKSFAGSPTKKRLYEDVLEPSMRSKVSREESTSSIPRSHIANHAQPIELSVDKVMPDYNNSVRQQKGRDSSSVSTGLQRSFGSTSSLGSFMTGLSTGRTTPNTSFGPPSTSNSLNTSYDQSDLVSTTAEKLPSRHEDDVDFDPMELDQIVEKLGHEQRPENLLPTAGEALRPAINPTVENYLQNYLFQQSPFSQCS